MKNWNGCKKEECKLWKAGRGDIIGCGLMVELEQVCDKTGCYFQPKPQEPVVEYEEIKCITALSMAGDGIRHKQIRDFYGAISGRPEGLMDRFEFGEYRSEFEAHGLISELERTGFIKRIEPKLKVGGFAVTANGTKVFVLDTECDGKTFADGPAVWAASCRNGQEFHTARCSLTPIPDPIFQKTE